VFTAVPTALVMNGSTNTQISLTGHGFGGPITGSLVTLYYGRNYRSSLRVAATDPTRVKAWYDDWIDLEVPLQVTTLQARVKVYRSTATATTAAQVYQLDLIPLPGPPPNVLTLAADGRVWVNAEFTNALVVYDPAARTRSTLPFPQAATGVFASTLFGMDVDVNWSELGEDVVETPDHALWGSWGGWADYAGPNPNHSVIGRLDSVTQTFRNYNLPGNNNEVNGMVWDAARGRMWAGTQGAIVSFDPTAPSTTTGFDFSMPLDAEWCQPGQTVGCFQRFPDPGIANPVETGRLAVAPDGTIWYTQYSWVLNTGSTYVGRLHPDTGLIEKYPMPANTAEDCAIGCGQWGLVAAPTGDIIVGDFGRSQLLKLPAAQVGASACLALNAGGVNPCFQVFPIPHVDTSAQFLDAVVDSGFVWFSTWTSGSQGIVGVLSPTGVITRLPIPDVPGTYAYCPSSLARNAATGELWTTDYFNERLAHFTPLQ
jgi:streptogramin lyase